MTTAGAVDGQSRSDDEGRARERHGRRQQQQLEAHDKTEDSSEQPPDQCEFAGCEGFEGGCVRRGVADSRGAAQPWQST